MATEEQLRTQLAAAAARGDGRAEAMTRFALAGQLRRRSAFAESRDELRRAADFFRGVSAAKELSTTLNNLGLVHIALNDFDGARHAFDEAIDLSSRLGDFDAVRRSLGNFAAAVSDAGDFEAARLLHQQALEIAANLKDVPGMARALSNLAWTEIRLGNGHAAVTATKAVDVAAAINDPPVLATVTHTHALVCLREGAYGLSVDEADWCRRTHAYLGDRDWVALTESTASLAAAAGGDWGRVASSVATSVGRIAIAQLRRGVAQRCVGLAAVATAAGQPTVADALCALAASIASALGDAPLGDAAEAQRRHRAASSSRGAAILRSCRAMFQPAGHAAKLVAVPWLDRRYGERPPAPPPISRGRNLIVGPLTLIDLSAEGDGWSLFQDLTTLLGTETNYDAEERIRATIERNDPLLAKGLVYDTEADNVSILAKTRDDILGVAAWVLSQATIA